MRHVLYVGLCCLACIFVYAQPAELRISRAEYIQRFKDEAVKEMHRTGIPASITLAQGILESGDGNSALARYANNHFGIKCHTGWAGESYFMDDDEKNECFRKYESAYESYKDHSAFLTGRQRYAELFELKTTDYKGWAHGLKKAGYATNPKYAELLIKLIEDHKLYEYDELKKIAVKEPVNKQATDKEKHLPELGTHHRSEIRMHNRIKYIYTHTHDTPESIAKQFDMAPWQIYRYNDLNKTDRLSKGQIVYLQPKRKRGSEDEHTVIGGENMWQISQQYGIKLKRLYKINSMVRGTQPVAGQVIKLR